MDEVGIKTPFSSLQYGGIPQNLVFNLIGWSLLVLLFTILRRSAGNYGRYAKRAVFKCGTWLLSSRWLSESLFNTCCQHSLNQYRKDVGWELL